MRGGSVGVLPRTRRRSIHDSRNLSRAPAASLRDRLRRPLTEPVCRMVRQLSGSGEGPGTGRGAAGLPETGREMAARTRASRCQPGDRGNGEQNQPLTATAAANRCRQRPATAHNSRAIAPTGDMSGLKAEGRRAISVQLDRVTSGQSRAVEVYEVGWSTGITGHDLSRFPS